jgi:hypothetical protein
MVPGRDCTYMRTEAVEIRRELAAVRPHVHQHELVASLRILAWLEDPYHDPAS